MPERPDSGSGTATPRPAAGTAGRPAVPTVLPAPAADSGAERPLREFTVRYHLDVSAFSPRDAAVQALRIITDDDPENLGKVFVVTDESGSDTIIDLSPGRHHDVDLSTDNHG